MKGGYQILDLTGETAGSPVKVKGIYKAAAGNNGKPVLILTNDGQRVYAEIAEDDGDFITCYISAEGKTVNITIESDDSVTTVISDPGASITGLEQAVNEIATNMGDVDGLTTTSKVVVGAINELDDNFQNTLETLIITPTGDTTAAYTKDICKFVTQNQIIGVHGFSMAGRFNGILMANIAGSYYKVVWYGEGVNRLIYAFYNPGNDTMYAYQSEAFTSF